MIILPAIDLYSGKAVRLYKGDYSAMTVYNDDALETAKDFEASGAEYIHIVDLEGAKSGETPNIATVERIVNGTSVFAEIGGGIRSMETIEKYISALYLSSSKGRSNCEKQETVRNVIEPRTCSGRLFKK